MPSGERSDQSISSKNEPRADSKPEHLGFESGSGPIAIISDIHSNLHALEAVFTECTLRNVRRFVCLGDIVGYGAFPSECLRAIRLLNCPTVLGNHDESVAEGKPAHGLNFMARAGIEYSVRCLDSSAREWLLNLPPVLIEKGCTFVHASLYAPLEWNYVTDEHEAEYSFVHQKTPVCFYGHTHVPELYVVHGSEKPELVRDQSMRLDPAVRYMINPGSVGQPRGGDPRAQFVLFDPSESTVEFVRVPYDVNAASKAILDAGLPTMLAERLHLGV